MADDGGGQGSRPDLEAYRRKRQAGRTPEPFAETAAAVAGGSVFVVQRHSARRLHYDLRLERGGVLASWAVPKGLPTAAGSKRLAVHTEDHPLSYATFEGVIPRGEYGAGTMDIYDRGVWEVVEERRDGGLTFRLHGDRLRGTWTLVPPVSTGRSATGCSCAGARTARTTRRARSLATSRCWPPRLTTCRRATAGCTR
jgi:bifunctional non-homologous end joining protein LigD